MPLSKRWEKLFHFGGNYITFVLKGNISIRSKNKIYDSGQVFLNASGTNSFEFKVISDVVLAVISMKPTAFYLYFNINPSEYVGRYISVEKLVGSDLQGLCNALGCSDTYEAIAGSLFSWVENSCKHTQNVSHIIDHIIDYIHSMNGCLKVQEIASRFCMSRRSLEKYFKKGIGISPAQYAKTCRFASVLTLLEQQKKIHINTIISILEYYDYTHFQKDFIRCIGIKFQDYIKERRHPLLEYTSMHNSNFSPV